MPANPLVKSATLFVFLLSFRGAAWPQIPPGFAPAGKARTGVEFTCPSNSGSPGKVIPRGTPIPDNIALASNDEQIAWACGKSQSSTANVGQTTGNATGDALNLAANLWIAQNVKNPYTANFMQNFSQGFLTAFFKDSAERQRQQQLMNEALQRQQQEAAQRARIAEQQRINATFARLTSELKLSGVAPNLSLKTSGTQSELPLKLGEENNQGAGINGLPGIYVGGPANAGSAHSGETTGLQLKLGDSSASAANSSSPKTPDAACPPPGGMGICGLPGIYLNDVRPAQAAEVASAAMNLPGPDRRVAEDAALAAAQKNPAIASPSDDPFVQDYQKEAASYADALKAQQDAWQKATEAQGHAQADKEAVEYIRGQIDTANQTEAQRQAVQQMIDAAKTDEDAAAAARQMFDQADAHLSVTRDRAADALASLALPTNPGGEPNSSAHPTTTAAAPLPVSPAPAASSSSVVDLSYAKRPLTPAILATPPKGGEPIKDALSACVARATLTPEGRRSVPTEEELRKQLEVAEKSYDRLMETEERELKDRADWIKEMHKATRDMRNGFLEAAIGRMLTHTQSDLRKDVVATRQEIESAQAALKADIDSQNSPLRAELTVLFEKRAKLLTASETLRNVRTAYEQGTLMKDFYNWMTNDGESLTKGNPVERSKNLDLSTLVPKEKSGRAAVIATMKNSGDLEAPMEGIKQLLKIGVKYTPIDKEFAIANLIVDSTYDLWVWGAAIDRLNKIKQNQQQFARAKVALADRIQVTTSELECYQRSH